VTAGLTQAELAEHADLAFETISRIESGREPPSLRTVVALADVFDVTLDEVTGRRRAKRRAVRVLPEVRRLIASAEALDPTLLGHLAAVAVALAKPKTSRPASAAPRRK
jgi:transcriptional regulator with XRE-family HTH domain